MYIRTYKMACPALYIYLYYTAVFYFVYSAGACYFWDSNNCIHYPATILEDKTVEPEDSSAHVLNTLDIDSIYPANIICTWHYQPTVGNTDMHINVYIVQFTLVHDPYRHYIRIYM